MSSWFGRRKPNPDGEKTVKLMLRLPKGLHDELVKAQKERGVSLNTLIVLALAETVGWSVKSQVSPHGDAPVAERQERALTKAYGDRKLSYVVTAGSKPGWMRLYCCHTNSTVQDLLRSHADDPPYFLEHLEVYKRGHFRAHHWLAKVIEDYREHFASGRVEIVVDANCDSLYDPTSA